MKLTIRKTLLFSLGIFALLGLAALAVTLFRVNRTVIIDGEFTYRESLPVTVVERGFVESVAVQSDTRVEKDDILVVLANRDLDREITLARQAATTAELELAEARRSQAAALFAARQNIRLAEVLYETRRIEADFSSEQHATNQKLFGDGSLTSDDLKASELSNKRAEAGAVEAGIQFEQSRYNLNELEENENPALRLALHRLKTATQNLDYLLARKAALTVRAPGTGMLISDHWDRLSNTFLNAGQIIGDVVSFDDINFDGVAKDSDVIRIREGQKAYFDVDLFRRKVFVNGLVTDIGFTAIEGPGGFKLFPVHIEVQDKRFFDRGQEFYIQAGVRGQAVIIVEEHLSLFSLIWEKILGFADFGVYTE